jgi:hypothetical protein
MDPSALDSREPAVVTDNEVESRFEIRVGGELAGFVGYILDGSLIDLVHTEIDPRTPQNRTYRLSGRLRPA